MCLFDVLTKCTARACLLLVSNIYSKHFHLLMYFLKFTFLHYTLFFIFDLVFEKILYTVENDLMCARWRFNDPYSVIRIEIRVDPALVDPRVDRFNDFFNVIAKEAYSTEGLFIAHFSSHTRTVSLGFHMRTNRLIYACLWPMDHQLRLKIRLIKHDPLLLTSVQFIWVPMGLVSYKNVVSIKLCIS